jgi:methylthioribose-1-phosphate isomerase
MTVATISWVEGPPSAIRVVEQTLLPGRTDFLDVASVADLVDAIGRLAVRGAPALGAAGALGVVLALDEAAQLGWTPARRDAAIDSLRNARPTAVNLAWGVDQVRPLVEQGRDAVLRAALDIVRADGEANRVLSRHGAQWLMQHGRDRVRVLTHCNAGALATTSWGTALGVVRELAAQGRIERVYVDETRPLLQGSRLTAWELEQENIPYVVQVDSAAASTILGGLVDVAIIGADRIAANGDTANKIGSLAVALACHAAGVPFMVAAPWSTVDLATRSGAEIEIEERPGAEVLAVGGVSMAPEGATGFNPAFDVTPARYIDAIVTERGVAEPKTGLDLSTWA